MNEVGVYYHDLDLVEAIVRNINALIMSQQDDITWEIICDTIKQYLKS